MNIDDLGERDRDLVDRWLHGRPARTQQAYENDLDHFFRDASARSIAAVTPADVAAFVACNTAAIGRGEISSRTADRRLKVLKSFFAFVDRERRLGQNPAIGVKAPRIAQERVARSRDESYVLAALNRAVGRDRALLVLAYVGGASAYELSRFQRGDFVGGHLLRFRGRRGPRIVKISESASAAIGAYLDRTSGDHELEHPFGPSTVRGMEMLLKAAAKRAGLGDVTASELRASHIAHAIGHGCPQHVVATTLGKKPVRWSPEMSRSAKESSALYLRA